MPVVLIREGRLGDVVLLGGVTSTLGRCVVACDPRYHEVVGRLHGVERVIGLDAVRDEPGMLVDLQGSVRTRWLCRGRPHRTIRKRGVRRRLWIRTGWLPLPRPTVPELYAEAAGVRALPPPWLDLPQGPRDALGLAPGAAFAPKQWAAERFVELGRRWDGPVVVFGGPGEEALVQRVTGGIPGAEPVVESGFARTLRALPRVAVMVSADTGWMHLAGASGAASVALFGPTDPRDGFWVYRGEALGRELGCRPCALHRVHTCHRGDHACMDHPVPDVLAAVRRALAGH